MIGGVRNIAGRGAPQRPTLPQRGSAQVLPEAAPVTATAADPRTVAGEYAGLPQRPGVTSARARAADFVALTKPRITRLVLVTTAAGFYMGAAGAIDLWLLLHTLVGTGLVASGTNALNHYRERDADGLMERTRDRPLPAGRLEPGHALLFASGLSILGLGQLLAFVNLATAVIVASCLVSYIFLYTPLKRRTSFNTIVGAVPGALPVVAGWSAAGAPLDAAAWALFGILFIWQLPHFLALAWMYRDDYRRGGFIMLTAIDPDGRVTARQILNAGVALIPISLLPTLLGLTGGLYFFGALALGLAFLAVGAGMLRTPTDRQARRLFRASVLYLPLLLLLMVVDKAPR